MSNFIPDGWEIKSIDEVATVFAGGTPSRSKPEYYVGNIPWVKSGEVNARLIYRTEETISDIAVKESSAKWAKSGSVLVAMYGATAGKVAKLMIDATLNQAVSAINGKHGATDNDFLLYAIESNSRELLNTVQGSGQPNLSGQLIKSLSFPVPPLPEQQKIATILSSVDDVIEKTRTQIDKLKNLKAGMMQELLTKGIGHTEFKGSPVGRIPSAWTAKLLDSVAKRGSGHTPSKTEDSYWNGGVKWISLSDSGQLDNLYIHKTKKEISELGLANSSAVLHPAGIVVMARDAGIGKSAITTSPMAVSQHFMAWLCGDRLDNYFLYYFLQYWKPQFENIAMGSTIKTIGLSYFRTMMIPVPPMDEQVKISSSLKAVDETLFSLNKKTDAARKLKQALMQDLLTGKVRVKPDSPEVAAA